MNNIDDIIKQEEIILRLNQDINSYVSNRKKNKVLEQINKLDFDQDTAVKNYLETGDDSYSKLINENFDLLINDSIEFVVTEENGSPLTSYAKILYGEIHNNGFLYFTTKETNIVVASFQAGFYPLSYLGIINYFGESNVRIEKKGYQFFGGRVPERFKGSIDRNGNILFNTTESYWESGGYYFVSHILADPFSKDEIKREKFLKNRIELKNRIKLFREKLTR
jgi:hypothetical protein